MSEIDPAPSLPSGAPRCAHCSRRWTIIWRSGIGARRPQRRPHPRDDAVTPRVALLWTQQPRFPGRRGRRWRRCVRPYAPLEQQLVADTAARAPIPLSPWPTPRRGRRMWTSCSPLTIRSAARATSTAARRERWRRPRLSDLAARFDGALLARTDLLGHAELLAEMSSERPSVTDFLMKSFGTVAVADDAIIGWCLSEYNTADRCEFGVATAVERRREGVGLATSAAAIARADRQGIRRVGWHCWADNAPSIALARALEFELRTAYPVAFAYVDPQQGLAVRGFMALEEGEMSQARDWLERAAALGPLPAWAIVHQARRRPRAGAPPPPSTCWKRRRGGLHRFRPPRTRSLSRRRAGHVTLGHAARRLTQGAP